MSTIRSTPTTDVTDDLTTKARETAAAAVAPAGKLSANERERLAALEAVVERHLASFVEAGKALMEIRDDRLYRETHGTFEEYLLDERWEISRGHGYRLIDAARVVTVMSPLGDTPANEAQARELVPLLGDAERMRDVFHAAAADGPVTAAKIRALVRKRTTDPTPRSAETESDPGPTPDRRTSVFVRDLPNADALLGNALFAKFETTVGDRPVITVNHRTRLVHDCIETDFATAIAQQEVSNAKLREELALGEQAVRNYKAAAKLLRPAFKSAAEAKAARRKPKAPVARKARATRDAHADPAATSSVSENPAPESGSS